MNYLLDLRSSNYVKSLRFYNKSPIRIALVIFIIFSPIILFFSLNLYLDFIESKASAINHELPALKISVEPLFIMVNETEEIMTRQILAKELKEEHKTWFTFLPLFHDAVPKDVFINTIEISSIGTVDISGRSYTLQAPAQLLHKIDALPNTHKAELNSITMDNEGNYAFKISLTLSAGDKVNDYD